MDPDFTQPLFPEGTKPQDVVNALQQFGGVISKTLPGRIAESAYKGFLAPGQALQSTPENPVTTEQLIQPAQDMLTLLAGGSNPEVGAAGIFGGKLAKTADLAALEKARLLESKGLPREDIHKQTGWFRGEDPGKTWQFEIPDNKSEMLSNVPRAPMDARDVFKHDELYAAYPDLKKMPVGDTNPLGPAVNSSGTYYRPGFGTGEHIDIQNSLPIGEQKESLLHELQHAVQNREGTLGTTGPASIFNPKGMSAIEAALSKHNEPAKEFLKKYGVVENTQDPIKHLQNLGVWDKLPDETKNYFYADNLNKHLDYRSTMKYLNQPAEREARNVETRMDMTPEQRMTTQPWITQEPFKSPPMNDEQIAAMLDNLLSRYKNR